eukprot:Hpha_TRINITY_DN18905_c0_g1::TRINITY_DN18905_c0_g1_i1::g.17669::m.17669
MARTPEGCDFVSVPNAAARREHLESPVPRHSQDYNTWDKKDAHSGSSRTVSEIIQEELVSQTEQIRQMTPLRSLLGALWMVLVVAVEVGISELVKYQGHGGHAYHSPYLITYVNHGTTGIACIIAGTIVVRCQGRTNHDVLLEAGFKSTRAAWMTAAWFAVLYKYNVLWAAAMDYTSVGVFYSISQSYCVIVFGLSVCLLGERVTALKVLSVLLCVGGVLFIAFSPEQGDKTSSSGHLEGVLLTLGFTVGQAVFTVLWGRYVGGAPVGTVLVFLGMMGTASLVLCWPPLPVLAWTGVEPMPLPTWDQVGLIASVAATAVLNNFTLMFALSFTSPLFVSVGKVLQIPFGALSDHFFHSENPTGLAGVGMGLVLCGFLNMTLERARSSAPPDAHHLSTAPDEERSFTPSPASRDSRDEP